MRTPYVSIDLETTGLNPQSCQILEIAAVIDDWKTDINLLQSFHAYVQWDQIRGEPFALAMNADIIRAITNSEIDPFAHRVQPDKLIDRLAHFLSINGLDLENVTAAGKNFAGFDKPFLVHHQNGWYHELSNIRFHHRVLDPAILYFRPDEDAKLPNMQTCLDRAGISHSVTHRALDDAIDVIRLLRAKF